MKNSTLHLDDLRVWLPGRGQVLGTPDAGLTLSVAGLTLLVGRSGSGASVLLDAVVGRLPSGAAVTGSIRVGSRRRTVKVPAFLPDALVREVTGSRRDAHSYDAHSYDTQVFDAQLVGEAGIAGGGPGRPLPLDASSRRVLAVAWAVARRPDLLLADQPLAGLRPEHRAPVAAALRRCADRGADVLVAEHVLEDLLPLADTVVELARGQALACAAATWAPRTLPLPPVPAAARALGLPQQRWLDPAALAEVESARLAVPRQAMLRHRGVGDVVASTSPERSRLGAPLDLHRHETIGVIAARGGEARALDVARRLTALANGRHTLPHPLVLPPGVTVAKLLRAWARRHRDASPVLDRPLLTAMAVPLDAARRTDAHSTGEAAALRYAMATSRPGAQLLVHVDAGLDAQTRRLLAAELHDAAPAPRIVVSHDVEFLVRACHRLVVLDADGGDQVGTPALLAHTAGALPALRRAGLRVHRVSDLVPAHSEGELRD